MLCEILVWILLHSGVGKSKFVPTQTVTTHSGSVYTGPITLSLATIRRWFLAGS
jgi:hypothetical protein